MTIRKILFVKYIIAIFSAILVVLVLVVGCRKRSEIINCYTQLMSEDVELYKYDTLELSTLYSYNNNSRVYLDSKVFNIVGDNLYLVNPDSITQREHVIQIIDQNAKAIYQKIKIRDWKTNTYKLQEIGNDNIIPLLTKQDTLFFAQNGVLKFEVNNTVTDCANFKFTSPMYNEFVAENGMYALRIHEILYMSCDLKNWRQIYKGRQGINKSMAFVKNPATNVSELIFSEYTPGAERFRHHIFKYNFSTNETRTIMTFYKRDEGLNPFARHIHILEKDPYTGDVWVGTGDTDDESHIYRSTDNGETFHLIGTGSQKWRVLAFIFTPQYVFWNIDSFEPQYLTRVDRKDLVNGQNIEESRLKRFSIINGACWGVLPTKTSDGNDIWVMSSNNEGGIFDNYCRTYGFTIDNGIPTFYELSKIKARTIYTQLFPIGVKNDGTLVLFDHEKNNLANYKIVRY